MTGPGGVVTFATSGDHDYSDHPSDCCGEFEYRPAGATSPWFCVACGTTRPDDPPAQRTPQQPVRWGGE